MSPALTFGRARSKSSLVRPRPLANEQSITTASPISRLMSTRSTLSEFGTMWIGASRWVPKWSFSFHWHSEPLSVSQLRR